MNYKIDGTERRYTIGGFPEFTVKAAREKAKELRNEIAVGADPAQNKRVRREAATMDDLVERYLREVLPRKAAAGTFRERDEKKMVNIVADLIGRDRKVDEVHLGDMEQLHRVVSKGSGPVRANRVLSIASKMFATALKSPAGENKPWRDATRGNPCKGVVRNSETEGERFFSEAEIEALLIAFDDLEALPRGEVDGGLDCLRLIMLTGADHARLCARGVRSSRKSRDDGSSRQRIRSNAKFTVCPLALPPASLWSGFWQNGNRGRNSCFPVRSLESIFNK